MTAVKVPMRDVPDTYRRLLDAGHSSIDVTRHGDMAVFTVHGRRDSGDELHRHLQERDLAWGDGS